MKLEINQGYTTMHGQPLINTRSHVSKTLNSQKYRWENLGSLNT